MLCRGAAPPARVSSASVGSGSSSSMLRSSSWAASLLLASARRRVRAYSTLPAAASLRVAETLAPAGDQPEAIAGVTSALQRGDPRVLLRGATGTGKTFVLAHVIANLGKPTLLLAPNKTIAAQLTRELRHHLPDASVHYFVSSFDMYVPESYSPVRNQARSPPPPRDATG